MLFTGRGGGGGRSVRSESGGALSTLQLGPMEPELATRKVLMLAATGPIASNEAGLLTPSVSSEGLGNHPS